MKVDRRIQRTRQLLQDSLIALILERGYDAITVQDVTDRANLGRATFYLHYRDKVELLGSSLETIFGELVNTLGPISRTDLEEHKAPLALVAFNHAQQHRDLYRIMLRGQGAAVMQGRIKTYLVAIIQQRIEQLFPVLPVPSEIIAQHMAGSLLALIGWWLESETPYSADAMAEIFQQLNTHALINYFGTRR